MRVGGFVGFHKSASIQDRNFHGVKKIRRDDRHVCCLLKIRTRDTSFDREPYLVNLLGKGNWKHGRGRFNARQALEALERLLGKLSGARTFWIVRLWQGHSGREQATGVEADICAEKYGHGAYQQPGTDQDAHCQADFANDQSCMHTTIPSAHTIGTRLQYRLRICASAEQSRSNSESETAEDGPKKREQQCADVETQWCDQRKCFRQRKRRELHESPGGEH